MEKSGESKNQIRVTYLPPIPTPDHNISAKGQATRWRCQPKLSERLVEENKNKRCISGRFSTAAVIRITTLELNPPKTSVNLTTEVC
jgi:hypothetical protein